MEWKDGINTKWKDGMCGAAGTKYKKINFYSLSSHP